MQHLAAARGAHAALALLALLLALALALGGCDDSAERAALVERAVAARAAGDAAGEIDTWRRLARLAPDDPAVRYGLARAYADAGFHQEAGPEIEAALRLGPKHAGARRLAALRLSVGDPAERQQALESLRSLTEEQPESVEAWRGRSEAARRLGELDETLAAAQRARELAPEAPESARLLARAYVLRGELAAAEPLVRGLCEERPRVACFGQLAQLISADPAREGEALALLEAARARVPATERADTYALAAKIQIQRHRLREAEETLRVGIGSEAGSLHLLHQLARVQAARGRAREAERSMEEVTALGSFDAGIQLELSRYLEEQKDLGGALAAAERAARLAPQTPAMDLQLAALRLERSLVRGDLRGIEDAERLSGRVLARDPFDPDALELAGRAALARGRTARAADMAGRAADLRPEAASAWRLRAEARLAAGDTEGALLDAREALRLAPTQLRIEQLLARIHVAMGDDATAVATARRVLQHFPGDAESRVLLAQALARRGNPREARQLLEFVPRELRSVEIHVELSRLLLAADRPDQARESLLSAVRMAPASAPILEALLDLDTREGRREESVKRIRKAGRLQTEDPALLRLRARLAREQGEPAQAEALLERARILEAPAPAS